MPSSDIAVSVRGLSKSYTIAHNAPAHTTAAEALMHRLRHPFQKTEKETFWALKDVEFDIKKGDVVGIIGRNGAGKSTLLKILSRITEPTTGQIDLYGRVGSLLEVGTGFHPELTGRENIFLNGAILGMSRREIAKQFDAIVDFSGTEQFLDTPVKRYSSGMYVRLAFAVAAHLNPEILIVDEVLAVGDAEFQKKCLGKMKDVANSGRTVLFVSHNMAAILQLCHSCILLRKGSLKKFGSTEAVAKEYLCDPERSSTDVRLPVNPSSNSPISISRCWIENEDGQVSGEIDVRKSFSIGTELVVKQDIGDVEVTFRVVNDMGHPVFTTNYSQQTAQNVFLTKGRHAFQVVIPAEFLVPGNYYVHVGVHRPNIEMLDAHDELVTFEISETGSSLWQYYGKGVGNILTKFRWKQDCFGSSSDADISDAANE